MKRAARIASDAFRHFIDDDGWAIASHIALSTLMALFPFLIMVTLIAASFFGSAELADEVARLMLETWPNEVATPLAREIRTVLTTTRGDVLTTFVFRVRNLPAALYKAMGGFATNGVNMTKLESYMVDGQFTATQFYAEVEGHPDDPAVARALEELDYFTTKLQILGTYPQHPYRRAREPAGD